ncbi:unnamed protein product [Leptosia nina]|uniref:Gustatory receptor n=1 Tax=Leptosia nina TaxID=320188 RepID=A0AAV1IW92_9NEOP
MTLGLESAFKIVFGMSRVLGVAPIRFSDMPRVSKILVIYGGILLLLTSYVYGRECASLVAEWSKETGEVNFTVKGSSMRLFQASDDYIIYVYAIVKSVPRTKFLLKIVNDLKKVTILATIFTDTNFPLARTVKHIVDDYNPDIGTIWNAQILIVLLIIRTTSDVILLQFVVVALLVHTMLQEFNRKLKNLFSTKSTSDNRLSILYEKCSTKRIRVPVKDISSTIDSLGTTLTKTLGIELGDTNDVDAIKRMTHIYISYCNFVRELNTCESVLIMAHVYKSAMHLIGNLILLTFSILSYFEYSSSQLWINRALYFSSMSIFYSMLLFLLVEPSYQANIEIKQTYLLVGKELNKALERNDVIEMSELRALLKQLRLNRPFYSGFGLCMLERPLLTTVVSAVATSLVLMFQ